MTISSSIGPISGIDYGKLIEGLIGLEQRPIDQITTRLDRLDKQNTAILGLSTLLTGLKIAAANFTSAAVFRSAIATSANGSIAAASAGVGTPTGSYSFNVQRLAAASQQVTQGFASPDSALGMSGSLKLQLGGGRLDDVLKLTALNGGGGVARGSIRVTDRSGASALIDLTHAVDIRDVVNTLNSATGVNILARLDGDRLVISDNTGAAGSLTITDAGGTTTASDLGLTVASVNGVIAGASVTRLRAATSLDALNDGQGVRTAGILDDFSITGNAGTFSVSLNSAKTLGDVITLINTAGASHGVSAAISADGYGITLTDSGGGPIAVSSLNGSLAAYDLGFEAPSQDGTLVGDRIASSMRGPLLRNLNGGVQSLIADTLPSFGTISINDQYIDLSSARTLDEAIRLINTNAQGVTAALNNAGTGLTLSSAGPGFTIADVSGNLASFLKIAGTSVATADGQRLDSGDLRLRYIAENTRLATLNGGAGVKLGSIRVSDGNGASLTLDLASGANTTVGAILKRINESGLAISARINDSGDGILLTQTLGTGIARIEDLNGGSTARDLGILGTFESGTLNGSFQKTIDIVAADKLTDIAKKINDANLGVSASIINDGSGATQFRLSLVSRNSGTNGRLIFDGSGLTAGGLTTTTLVEGQDAAVIFGGNSIGTGGLLSTSSSNTLTGLVPGLTLTLNGVGSTSITVNRDDDKIKTTLEGFVEAYNKVVDNLAEVTRFDTDATKRGVLFGDTAAQQVQNALGLFAGGTFGGISGKYRNLASVGIAIAQNGTLSLDSGKFTAALAANPDDVRALFTTNVKAVTGGLRSISTNTLLTALTNGTSFPAGRIAITDGFGTVHEVDLSSGVSSVGQVIDRINAATAGTIMASINASGDGIRLTQVGGTGAASVAEVGNGSTAAALNILGTFAGGVLDGAFPPIAPVRAVKGVGATLSDLLDRFTNGQTGILFKASDALSNQQIQLKTRQTQLNSLLTAKKERLIREYSMLEVTIAQLQQQGTALTSYVNAQTNSASK